MLDRFKDLTLIVSYKGDFHPLMARIDRPTGRRRAG
jgi:hypothetical protein